MATEPAPYQDRNLSQIPDNHNIDLTDEQLVNISTKEFNRRLENSGLSGEDCKKLRAKRRTLKNRGYAASCRYKRDEQERNLQDTKNKLKNDIDALKRNSEDLERSTQNLKESNLYRLKWALRANIDIPDHIKMSYPPEVQAQALLLPEHGKPT